MNACFFIRTENKFVRICYNEILFIESLKNYIRIYTKTKKHLVLITLKQMEQELPQQQFCRIHRSYLVNLAEVVSFDQDGVHIGEQPLPLSTNYRAAFLQKIKIMPPATRQRPSIERSPLLNAPHCLS